MRTLLQTLAAVYVLAATAAISEASAGGGAFRSSLSAGRTIMLSTSANVFTSQHAGIAFQHHHHSNSSPIAKKRLRQHYIDEPRPRREAVQQQSRGTTTTLFSNPNNKDESSSFLSTSKASVSIPTNNNPNAPANVSPIDSLLLTLTSSQTSLLLGSIGIVLLLFLRLISFPEDAMYEVSRSRIDLLGVFAAGSVLLNGITKLDVTSVQADGVMLEGVNEGAVTWTDTTDATKQILGNEKAKSTAEWALSSFLRCSPARTAILLATNPKSNQPWTPVARVGIVPSNPKLRSSIPDTTNTPILDRMLRMDGSIKGGTVGGVETAGTVKRKGPNESYLPTLQALPGKVEFTYLPPNAQEALILPVSQPSEDGKTGGSDGWYYAVVMGGDTAKSFAPRDIAWCKEIASWIGDLL